jgi:hypothetical protein
MPFEQQGEGVPPYSNGCTLTRWCCRDGHFWNIAWSSRVRFRLWAQRLDHSMCGWPRHIGPQTWLPMRPLLRCAILASPHSFSQSRLEPLVPAIISLQVLEKQELIDTAQTSLLLTKAPLIQKLWESQGPTTRNCGPKIHAGSGFLKSSARLIQQRTKGRVVDRVFHHCIYVSF